MSQGEYGKTQHRIDWVACWILFSTWCSITGWLLSALEELNCAGYGVSLLVFIVGMALIRRELQVEVRARSLWCRKPLASRQWLPKIWLLLVCLLFIGGLLYHPNNYDYLTYRFPRILHWWWEQKWHWIDTVNERLNYSGAGTEWMMMPLFIFFKTDRFFFLINYISYLLMPGLVFSVFRSLGLGARLSWWWMWILPAGYCYLLQAASMGNDSLGAIYFLAALHYAFKARDSKNILLSFLAMALTTGIKASNLPLALPWLMAFVFNGRYALFKMKPVFAIVALLAAGLISFLPIAALNIRYTGDYAGDPQNQSRMKMSNPVSAVAGNVLELVVGNLSPPIWPRTISWESLIPSDLKERLTRDFPRFSAVSGEMQIEEAAGAGLGIALAVGAMMVAGFKHRTRRAGNWEGRWIMVGAGVATMVFIAKMAGGPRLTTSYYPILIAGISLLAAPDGSMVRRPFLKMVAIVAMLSALPLIFLSPARPLVPVGFIGQYLDKVTPSAARRFHEVYGVYAGRYDNLQDLRKLIPANEKAIGLVEDSDTSETSLWRPFGIRHVVVLTPQSSPDDFKANHVHYVVVEDDALNYIYHLKIKDLQQAWSATLVAQKILTVKAQRGDQTWYVLYVPF